MYIRKGKLEKSIRHQKEGLKEKLDYTVNRYWN